MCEINEIGARLRELRETSDYTVEQLAAELNVSPEVYVPMNRTAGIPHQRHL